MKFGKPPVKMTPEQIAEASRFVGYQYDPEEDARMRAYAEFKIWSYRQMGEAPAKRKGKEPPAE